MAEVHTPLVIGEGHRVKVATDGCNGTISLDEQNRVVAVEVEGRPIGAAYVRAADDLRIVVSELLRLSVPWLPSVDGEARLQGFISQAAIGRMVGGGD